MTRFLFLFLFVITSAFSQQKIETKKVSSTISKHGITLQDDYAWLENTSDKEVADWVNLQNSVSEEKLKEFLDENLVKNNINNVWNYKSFIWYKYKLRFKYEKEYLIIKINIVEKQRAILDIQNKIALFVESNKKR